MYGTIKGDFLPPSLRDFSKKSTPFGRENKNVFGNFSVL
jgi:hypothetical protein